MHNLHKTPPLVDLWVRKQPAQSESEYADHKVVPTERDDLLHPTGATIQVLANSRGLLRITLARFGHPPGRLLGSKLHARPVAT